MSGFIEKYVSETATPTCGNMVGPPVDARFTNFEFGGLPAAPIQISAPGQASINRCNLALDVVTPINTGSDFTIQTSVMACMPTPPELTCRTEGYCVLFEGYEGDPEQDGSTCDLGQGLATSCANAVCCQDATITCDK
ncbi:hypothetical protein SARC_11748, partial [Sphaeroforma arctica JP610]